MPKGVGEEEGKAQEDQRAGKGLRQAGGSVEKVRGVEEGVDCRVSFLLPLRGDRDEDQGYGRSPHEGEAGRFADGHGVLAACMPVMPPKDYRR